MPCALDSQRQVLLVICRNPGYTPWKNFTTFSDETLQRVNVFVVNVFNARSCERALFLLFEPPALYWTRGK